MPWSGSAPSQVFTRTDGTSTGDATWQQAAAAPRRIESDDHDTHDTDLKDGINACLKKDGGNTASADIPMGGNTLTNIAEADARTEPARFSQVQDNKGQYIATVGGTADVITLTPAIAITAYAAGQRFSFIAGGTNTGATTVNVSAVGAKSIVRPDGANTALAAGEITSGALVDIEYDGTRFHLLAGGSQPLRASNNLSDVGSAATARTNLGVGTGDSPQFTGVNVGHASDTTITRTGAGDIAVEGNALYRAGGTDVPVADGGTGASSAANARTNLGLVYASQAEMETGTATDRVAAPGTVHFHIGHPKAGGNFDGTGTPAFRSGDYGMGSITDNGTGDYTLALDTAFADTDYWFSAWARSNSGTAGNVILGADSGGTKTESSLNVISCITNTAAHVDTTEAHVTFWGDYA